MTLAEPARDIRIDERVISAITLNLQSNRVLEVALKKNVTLVIKPNLSMDSIIIECFMIIIITIRIC